jgi:hypothetical protein
VRWPKGFITRNGRSCRIRLRLFCTFESIPALSLSLLCGVVLSASCLYGFNPSSIPQPLGGIRRPHSVSTPHLTDYCSVPGIQSLSTKDTDISSGLQLTWKCLILSPLVSRQPVVTASPALTTGPGPGSARVRGVGRCTRQQETSWDSQ